jgi:hypothetical protein
VKWGVRRELNRHAERNSGAFSDYSTLSRSKGGRLRISISQMEMKAILKNCDMPEKMKQDAVDCAAKAVKKHNTEKVSDLFKSKEKIPPFVRNCI